MEYRKHIKLVDNTSKQPSKFRTKSWFEVNMRRICNTNTQIKSKTTMRKSSLCDYYDAYILVNRTITITRAETDPAARNTDERNNRVTFQNCATFTESSSEINITNVDNAKNLDVVKLMRQSRAIVLQSLWQFHKDDPNGNITDRESFRFKAKIAGGSSAAGNTKDVEIAVPLKQLSNLWRKIARIQKIAIPLINCEINLLLSRSINCIITNLSDPGTFETTDTQLYQGYFL